MRDLESPVIDLEPHEWERLGKAWWELDGEAPYEPPIYWGSLVIFLFTCAIVFWAHWYVYPNRPPIDLGWLGTIY